MKQMPPIREDTILTLQQACDYCFVNEVMTPSTLKHEWARGNLDLSKIGRSYFTTPADIKEMKRKCLVEAQAQNSGSTKPDRRGRSSMDESAAAQASVLQKLQERRQRLGITSRRSTQ